jgi:hypothetical protein
MGVLVNSTGHGFSAGDEVIFSSLVGGDGLIEGDIYYVLADGLTSDAFKVSLTDGGTAVTFTSDIESGDVAAAPTYTEVVDGVQDAPTAPATPSAPVLASASVAGLVRLNVDASGAVDESVRAREVQITTEFSGSDPVWTNALVNPLPDGTTALSVPAAPAIDYAARVRHQDVFGNYSLWSDPDTHTTLAGNDSLSSSSADDVADGVITETKIADDAITTPKIAAGAITAAKIAAGEITADKLLIGNRNAFLSNPNFEGGLTGWTQVPATGGSITYDDDPANSLSGTGSVLLTNDVAPDTLVYAGSGGGVNFAPVSGGETILVSAVVRASSAATDFALRVYYHDGDFPVLIINLDEDFSIGSSFETVTASFTLPSAARYATVALVNKHASRTVRVDDVIAINGGVFSNSTGTVKITEDGLEVSALTLGSTDVVTTGDVEAADITATGDVLVGNAVDGKTLTVIGGGGSPRLGIRWASAAHRTAELHPDGEVRLGDGTVAPSVRMYHKAADTLGIDDEVDITIGGGKDTLQLSSTAADTGITIGGDANLYRSAANTLKTDDTLLVGAGTHSNLRGVIMVPFSWTGTLAGTGTLDVPLFDAAVASAQMRLPFSASVIGVSITLGSARTAGTLVGQAYNGSSATLVGPTATINAGTTNNAIGTAAVGTADFSATQLLRLRVTTTAFTPTANNVKGMLFLSLAAE